MPRKRHRTPFNALSHSTPLYYPPSATTQHPSTSNLHIRISVTAPPTTPPLYSLYLTPTPSRPFNPHSLPFPTNRSGNPYNNENNDNPAPSPRPATNTPTNTPTATPPTDLVARSLLDAMNQSLPPPLPPPSSSPFLPQHTPDSRNHPHNNNASTAQFADVTPLLLGNSGIRSAQLKLGISPDSPSSYLVPIPLELELQLRQAQLAARRLTFDADTESPRPPLSSRQCTPLEDDIVLRERPVQQRDTLDVVGKYACSPLRANMPMSSRAVREEDEEEEEEEEDGGLTPAARRRRLSGASAVTPIPMFLESPPIDVGVKAHASRMDIPESELEPQAALFGRGLEPASDAAVQKGVASPITPAQGDASLSFAVGVMGDEEDAHGVGQAGVHESNVDVASAVVVPVDTADGKFRTAFIEEGAGDCQPMLKHGADFKAPLLSKGIENLRVHDCDAPKERASSVLVANAGKHKGDLSASHISNMFKSRKVADNVESRLSRLKRDISSPVAPLRACKSKAGAAGENIFPAQSKFKTAMGNLVHLPRSAQSPSFEQGEQSNYKIATDSSLLVAGRGESIVSQQKGKPATPKSDVSHQPQSFKTKKEPLHLPPSTGGRRNIFENSGANVTSEVSLFTTGGGNPVRISCDYTGRPLRGTSDPRGFTDGKTNIRTASLFTTGKGDPVDLPIPKEPVNGKRFSSEIESLFTTGKGTPIHIPTNAGPPASRVRKTPMALSFTTGKGTPVQIPDETGIRASKGGSVALESFFISRSEAPLHTSSAADATTPMKDASEGMSLFTTGKGVPVQLPSATNIHSNRGNCTPFKTPFKNSSRPMASNSLFTTGSGKKLPVPTPNKEKSSPIGKATNDIVSGLHTTGQGLRSTTPDAFVQRPRYTLRPRRSPQTPLTERCGNVISTITDPVKSAGKISERPRTRTPTNKGPRSAKSRSRLKTTPFKRPRQIRRPHKYFDDNNRGRRKTHAPVPLFDVPWLLKTGCIACGKPDHSCAKGLTLNMPQGSLNYQNLGSFKRCHYFTFPRNYFGNIACVPFEAAKILNLHEKNVFGVQECVEWMKEWFPAVANKPVSYVGSEAWTRLSYALAVWKLARYTSPCEAGSFLSAANIVRELLRRIYYEWHKNKQPHLLRMMRRDSAPASHAVFLILDIERGDDDRVIILLSDGWYLARAAVDKVLEKRIFRGRIRIGEKIHISGAGLQAASRNKPFFFGDGDELCSNLFSLSANNVQIRKGSQNANERLGIQRSPLIVNSLQGVLDDCGACPTARVVILRSYPIFFVETVESKNDDVEDTQYVVLREEAEYETRARHEENIRQRFLANTNMGQMAQFGSDVDLEVPSRNVRCVKEVLVCGTGDDAAYSNARKLVRVYNCTGDVQACLSKEGNEVLMAQLWPKKNTWVGKPEGILPSRSRYSSNKSSLLEVFPRKICSTVDLQSGQAAQGSDFDGVFCVLHVTNASGPNDQRFVYLADDVGSEVGILALELSGYDSNFLPTVFRLSTGAKARTSFGVVALRDIEFQAASPKHDLVHIRASLRSSFTSCKALKRQKGRCGMKQALQRIESNLDGKQAQLEILREAVISFASGARASIGAYFTSTQDT